ncbi:MAG TPA: hypothetical protein VHW26_02730 [Solirubrobacteraceae bacterium]|jgi:hypothetical protein|nr:hypothetical protein [Solirubrobacteraceae bacterium]
MAREDSRAARRKVRYGADEVERGGRHPRQAGSQSGRPSLTREADRATSAIVSTRRGAGSSVGCDAVVVLSSAGGAAGTAGRLRRRRGRAGTWRGRSV